MEVQAPTASASITVQTFTKTNILLTVIKLHLSTALITMPHTMLPHLCLLPSQQTRIAFHGVVVLKSPTRPFVTPSPKNCNLNSLQIVLMGVLHVVADLLHWARPYCLLYTSDSVPVPIDPSSATSLPPHTGTAVPSLLTEIVLAEGISILVLFLVCCDTFSKRCPVHDSVCYVNLGKCHKIHHVHPACAFFLFAIQSSSSAHTDANLSHTHRGLCHLHVCFRLVWLLGEGSFLGLHQHVLLQAKMCCNVSIVAMVLHTPSPAIATYFQQ